MKTIKSGRAKHKRLMGVDYTNLQSFYITSFSVYFNVQQLFPQSSAIFTCNVSNVTRYISYLEK